MHQVLSFLPDIESEYIFITGDYSFLPRLGLGSKYDSLGYFHEAVLNKYSNSTIVFPLASMNLCNTSIPFSTLYTASHQMGAYSEFIRVHHGCERTIHPFWSCGAIGSNASTITKNISPHAFATNSIWDRLCNNQAVQLTLNKPVTRALTTVHHCECISGVPYRYTKEFYHPMQGVEGSIYYENFYLSVFYANLCVQKRIDRNVHFVQGMAPDAHILYSGSNSSLVAPISVLNLNAFRETTCNIISSNMYTYLQYPPDSDTRPYRK